MYVCMYVCMYVYFYLNSQVHTGYKPNYMEANAIMRPIKKKRWRKEEDGSKATGRTMYMYMYNVTL